MSVNPNHLFFCATCSTMTAEPRDKCPACGGATQKKLAITGPEGVDYQQMADDMEALKEAYAGDGGAESKNGQRSEAVTVRLHPKDLAALGRGKTTFRHEVLAGRSDDQPIGLDVVLRPETEDPAESDDLPDGVEYTNEPAGRSVWACTACTELLLAELIPDECPVCGAEDLTRRDLVDARDGMLGGGGA